MQYTQNVGNVNELKCMLAFIELGYECSIPYGNGARYDFIVDINSKLLRIQCKSSSYVKKGNKLSTQSIKFNCYHSTLNTKGVNISLYTKEDIDYFATYFNNKVYIIPVEECQSRTKCLYLSDSNKLLKNRNYASEYEISNFVKGNINIPDNSIISNSNKLSVKQYYCKYCGIEVSYGKDCCSNCFHKHKRKVERPNKEELLNLIMIKSFSEIGRFYSVSDNTIRKWCKQYGLPYRKKDLIKN